LRKLAAYVLAPLALVGAVAAAVILARGSGPAPAVPVRSPAAAAEPAKPAGRALGAREPGSQPPAEPAAVPVPSIPPPAPAKPEPWKLVFEDKFDRDQPGEGWRVLSGKWSLEDRRLHGRPAGDWGEAEIALVKVSAPDCVRVEYVGFVEGLNQVYYVCDLSALIGVNSEARKAAYFFSFNGANKNGSSIERGGRVLTSTMDRKARPESGRRYTVLVERTPQRVRLALDGQTILEAPERLPGPMAEGDRVSLYTYGSHAYLERVRVWVGDPELLKDQAPVKGPAEETF